MTQMVIIGGGQAAGQAVASLRQEGFEAKINNELANNIGNFVNRCLTFFYKNFHVITR